MALTNELARYLLGRSGQWTERERLNVATTALFVAMTDHTVHHAWLDGHRAGRFDYDSVLIADWYAAAPRRIKLELIVAGTLGFLEPKRFEAVFLDAVHLRGLTDEQHRAVIGMLDVFLRIHPERAHHYEPYILGFLRSRRHDDRLFGLPLVAWLDRIERPDLEIMRACLSSSFDLQMHALNAFCEWLKRPRTVAPEVLAFSASEDIASRARQLYRKAADKDVRTCAYYYLKAWKHLPARWRRARPSAR
jgi:hypothetical protein